MFCREQVAMLKAIAPALENIMRAIQEPPEDRREQNYPNPPPDVCT